jgi:hypothetical protein
MTCCNLDRLLPIFNRLIKLNGDLIILESVFGIKPFNGLVVGFGRSKLNLVLRAKEAMDEMVKLYCDLTDDERDLFFKWKESNNNITRQADKDGSVEGVVEQKDCPDCLGEGVVDSGGFTPWGAGIDIPCRRCIPNAETAGREVNEHSAGCLVDCPDCRGVGNKWKSGTAWFPTCEQCKGSGKINAEIGGSSLRDSPNRFVETKETP